MVRKILYVAPSSGLGGAETFLKNTYLGHDRQSFTPIYLLFRHGPLEDWLRARGASVFVLPQTPRLSQPLGWLKTHQFICDLIHKESIDLVHSTMAYGALFTAWAARKTGRPHLWFQHGPASGGMDTLAGIFPHQALVVNSDYTLRRQKDLEGWWTLGRERREHRLYLGVDSPPISPAQQQEERRRLIESHRLSPSCVLIGMACRIQKWKGVHLLLEALRQLDETKKIPAHQVFIFGEAFHGDEYLKDLRAQSKNLPISFVGASANIPLSLSACDIIVNASIQAEPFGLSLIEGMAAGCAPIAPREGGPAEFLEEGVTGLLFEPRNASDMATKLALLVTAPDRLDRLKKSALAAYNTRFTLATMMSTLEKIYIDLLTSPK